MFLNSPCLPPKLHSSALKVSESHSQPVLVIGSRRNNKVNYPCIPEWQRSQVRDPFDYQLRTPEEVAEHHKYFPPCFNIQATYKRYTAGDVRINNEDNLDNRERVAKFRLDMRELRLAPLQRERFIYLLGRRYNPTKPHSVKIVVKQYNTFSENYIRAAETLREIYWEALRAPETDVIAERNPYRGEFLKKKMFGKTKEERKANKKQFALDVKEHMENVDREEIESETKDAQKTMSLRAKRRAQAAKRAKLGFNEEEENVEDSIMDKMDRDDALY